MSAAKHTPGPWTALVIGPNNMDRGTAMVATTHRAGMAIDCFDSGKSFAESAANACLVAAAPDLLEALRLASTAMSCTEALLRAQGHPDADAMAVGLQHIDAAIARATGSAS